MTNNHTNLVYPELSYKITGICFRIQNEYGRFLKEKRYCDLLEEGLNTAGLSYKREYSPLSRSDRVDFLVEEKIVIEVKAKRYIIKDDLYQTQRYLQIMNIRLGLIVNFRNRFLKPNRVIRIDTDRREKYILD